MITKEQVRAIRNEYKNVNDTLKERMESMIMGILKDNNGYIEFDMERKVAPEIKDNIYITKMYISISISENEDVYMDLYNDNTGKSLDWVTMFDKDLDYNDILLYLTNFAK